MNLIDYVYMCLFYCSINKGSQYQKPGAKDVTKTAVTRKTMYASTFLEMVYYLFHGAKCLAFLSVVAHLFHLFSL